MCLTSLPLRCLHLITIYRSSCVMSRWDVERQEKKAQKKNIMEFVIYSTSLNAEHPWQAVGEQAEGAYIHRVLLIISAGQQVPTPPEWVCHMSISSPGLLGVCMLVSHSLSFKSRRK